MLVVGKGESLDLKEVGLTQQAIDVNTKGVSGEFGVETGAQAPKGRGVIGFDVQVFGQLGVDGLNDLAHGVEQTANRARQLDFLVAPR